MAYGRVDKSNCAVHKGNCQIRLDFYLEASDPRYDDRHLYLVDETSPEYQAGYPGPVGKGNPVDQEDFDRWWGSLPKAWKLLPFHSHFIYLPATFTEEDIKAAIEFHLPNFYKAFQERWDETAGGMRHGWATRTRPRPIDYSKTTSAEYDARGTACRSAIDSLAGFSHKPSKGKEGDTFPATVIDIGAAAINRTSSAFVYFSGPYTLVEQSNPANDTGTIDYCEIWLSSAVTPDIWIGTFSAVGAVLTCRDSESIGNVPGGSLQTYSGLDIDVETGDLFGVSAKTAAGTSSIERSTSGYVGFWQYVGECIDPSDSQTFVSIVAPQISLYGTGDTGATAQGKTAHMAAKLIAGKVI